MFTSVSIQFPPPEVMDRVLNNDYTSDQALDDLAKYKEQAKRGMITVQLYEAIESVLKPIAMNQP